MIKKMVCIECPKSCVLSADIENCKIIKVNGAKCPRGVKYALAEVENPSRILTATVMAEGLDLRLIPVRTDKPIPKKDIFRAMEQINKMKISTPLRSGETLVDNFLGLGVRLLATRDATEGKGYA